MLMGWQRLGRNLHLFKLSGECWGLPEKFGWVPEHARERVLGAFKHKVRVQRDCNSLCWLHKFQKVWIRLHVPSRPLL
jgi:hypothetical protein